MNDAISVVVPVYNEEGNIPKIYEELNKVLPENFELIFVNDFSSDKSLEVLKSLSAKDERVQFISFSKNFGHQYALRAGLERASGDAIIMMDADLQHPPEIIPEMITHWKNGNKVVYTLRNDYSCKSKRKKASSQLFYWLLGKLSDVKLEAGAADFRLIDKQVLTVIKEMPEYFFFIRGIIPWLGFKSVAIEYEPAERFWGKTQFTYKKMFQLAILGLTSFSTKPLTFSIYLGFGMSIMAFLYSAYAVIAHLFFSSTVPGWSSIVASVMFVGGIQLVVLGVIGHYVGNIFLEVKRRPSYIIEESSF